MKNNPTPSSVYHSLFNQLPSAVVICKPTKNSNDFIVADANNALQDLCNTNKKSLIGKTLHEIFPKTQATGLPDLVKQVYQDGNPIKHPTTVYHTQEQTFWATTCISKFDNDIAVIFHDITKTKNNRIEEEHLRLTTAIRHTADTIVITDTNGNIQYVNPAFENLTGHSQAEVIGLNPSILKSGVHSKEFYKQMWDTISSGNVWRGRICNRRKDGTFFTEDASISPVLSADNEIQNYIAVKQDITRELELMEQLQHTAKIEVISTLAGGIAHDFNNILTTINGFTILAQDTLTPEHEAYDDLQQVLIAGDRAADLVKQILIYSRKQKTDLSPVQPSTILKETYKMLQASLPPNIKLNIYCDEECHFIDADTNQIQQIIVNLASNASHAMEKKGGTLSLSLVNSPATPKFTVPHIVFTISDSGTGIDKKIRDKVFDPFFTTKAIGKGTGLGLSVVHGIVEAHDGSIELENSQIQGSTFTIRIPAVTEEENLLTYEEIPQQVSKGEHVLIVDDEPAVGEILTRILNKAGYQTTFFESSRKALLHYNMNPTKYDLLLTDFIMPDIDGSELAMLMVQKNKNLQVIICTGHVGSFGDENGSKKYPTNFLYKPIKKEHLLRTVSKILSN